MGMGPCIREDTGRWMGSRDFTEVGSPWARCMCGRGTGGSRTAPTKRKRGGFPHTRGRWESAPSSPDFTRIGSAREQRRRGGMGPRLREDTGRWMGSRPRLHGGQALRGHDVCVEEGRAVREPPVLREERRVSASARTMGGGGVPASVFMGAGSPRGDGDGSPHPRDLCITIESHSNGDVERLLP